MKKISIYMLLALSFVAVTSCEEDPATPPPTTLPSENVVVSGALTENTTWTADAIYELASKVVVGDGVTLTIEPGTIIKGRTGSGSLATALLVARGGKNYGQWYCS